MKCASLFQLPLDMSVVDDTEIIWESIMRRNRMGVNNGKANVCCLIFNNPLLRPGPCIGTLFSFSFTIICSVTPRLL